MKLKEFGNALTRYIPGDVLVLSVLFVGLFSACETQQQRIVKHEDKLSAAGFVVKPAKTTDQLAMLARLPTHRFVRRQNGDTVDYVYADPIVCTCLYVGTQQAYNQYKANQLAQHLADEQLLTAETYSDASWNWDAWGSWDPGYGFRRGRLGW